MYLIVFLLLFLAGCTGIVDSDRLASPAISDSLSMTPSVTFMPTYTTTTTPIPTGTIPPTATPALTATVTPSLTPSPVYEILRGMVNVEHVMCFYGPSKAYLYKYGLLGGSNLEILGIMRDTGYIQVRAVGGDNPCWMNLEWMNVKGNVENLQPMDSMRLDLPWSPYYGPLASVTATRKDNQVTISWSPLVLRAGDDSEQEPYLVETWVCQSGLIRFIPFGVYETTLTVEDQSDCGENSHGRVYGVEKHGYTLPVNIPWPVSE